MGEREKRWHGAMAQALINDPDHWRDRASNHMVHRFISSV